MYQPTEHKRNKLFTYWIEIVGTCNLRCPSCPQGNFRDPEFAVGRNPTGFMKLAVYKQILEKIKSDNISDRVEIHLYTWGEPLLHPKVAEFVALTKDMGFFCGLSSNLNLDKNLKEVIKARPDFFRISLSGFYQDNYQKTHKRGDIRVVKSNMYRLRHMLDQYESKTEVHVLYHVYKHNAGDDLLMMLKLCTELCFAFEPVWAFYMPLEKSLSYLGGTVSSEDKKIIDMLAMDPARVSRAALPSRDQDCNLRKTQMTLNIDGSVQLCCATFDKAQVVAPSFVNTSHNELQSLRYKNDICGPCMDNGQHVYFTMGVGEKLDEMGEQSLKANHSKFIFKQFSEPHLSLRDENEDMAIALPRLPKKKHNRGLRRLTNKLLGRQIG
jgi:organic radical activating enzyme